MSKKVVVNQGEILEEDIHSTDRCIGIELELDFERNDIVWWEEWDREQWYRDNPDAQETIRVFSETYNEHFEVDNPHYDIYLEPDTTISDMREDVVSGTNSRIYCEDDGSLINGVEMITIPIELKSAHDYVKSHDFDMLEKLWATRDEDRTEDNAGVHIHITRLHEAEPYKLALLLAKLRHTLAGLTRDADYAYWMWGYTVDDYYRYANDQYWVNGRESYPFLRMNRPDGTSTMELRFFHVPYYDFKGTFEKYINLIKSAVLIIENLTIDEIYNKQMIIDSDTWHIVGAMV